VQQLLRARGSRLVALLTPVAVAQGRPALVQQHGPSASLRVLWWLSPTQGGEDVARAEVL
jgi:hypothetical protein